MLKTEKWIANVKSEII